MIQPHDHGPDDPRVPSPLVVRAIADALKDFLAAYNATAVPLELAEPRGHAVAMPARVAVLEGLVRLERLVNPERRPVGASRSYVVTGWPDPIATAWDVVFWGVRDIVVAWDVPEICIDRPIKRVGDRGGALPRYVLAVDQVQRLAWAQDALAGGLKPPRSQEHDEPAEQVKPKEASQRRVREPCDMAFAAYRAVKLGGLTQITLAGKLRVTQGTISRWIGQVIAWIKAGNVLPDEVKLESPRPRQVPMDPRSLEQGPGRSGRK